MADSKLSELTAATSAAATDTTYLVQSSSSKQITIANLFKQIPHQSKLNETIMNQNLILPYKKVLNFSL